MILIANVDKNWAIGKDNRLLTRIPEDMKFFKSTTMGGVVVMGRKTFESFPGKKVLDGRVNVILTRDPSYAVKDALIVHSEEELLEALKAYTDREIFVIGGESIYRLLEPKCDTAYITKMDYAFDADAHFPSLDELEGWEMTEIDEEMTSFDIIYHHTVYRRIR